MNGNCQARARALAGTLHYAVKSAVPLPVIVRGLADSLRLTPGDYLSFLYPLSILSLPAERQRADFVRKVKQSAKRLEAGMSLSQALNWFGMRWHLPHYFIPMIEVGEATGDLEHALALLGDRIEHERPLQPAIQAVFEYLYIYLYLGAYSLFVFGLIKAASFSDPMNDIFGLAVLVALPLTHFFLQALWYLLTHDLVLSVLVRAASLLPGVRSFLMSLALRQCAHGFATYLKVGCGWPEAVQRVRDGQPLPWIRPRLQGFQQLLEEGLSWDQAWLQQGWGNSLTDLLIVNGHACERAPESLQSVANVLDEQLNRQVRYVGFLLRPAAVLAVASVVSLFIFSYYTGYFADIQAAIDY